MLRIVSWEMKLAQYNGYFVSIVDAYGFVRMSIHTTISSHIAEYSSVGFHLFRGEN